jgi:hypothetical protein
MGPERRRQRLKEEDKFKEKMLFKEKYTSLNIKPYPPLTSTKRYTTSFSYIISYILLILFSFSFLFLSYLLIISSFYRCLLLIHSPSLPSLGPNHQEWKTGNNRNNISIEVVSLGDVDRISFFYSLSFLTFRSVRETLLKHELLFTGVGLILILHYFSYSFPFITFLFPSLLRR